MHGLEKLRSLYYMPEHIVMALVFVDCDHCTSAASSHSSGDRRIIYFLGHVCEYRSHIYTRAPANI